MTVEDQAILALTVWRECRGGGQTGMQSVANVILNRVARHNTDAYSECVKRLQFSSITAKGDPELILWPDENDPQWKIAESIAAQAASSVLEDITNGSDLYYAPVGQTWKKRFTLPNGTSVVFPDSWNVDAVEYQCTIASQLFFRSK